MQITLICLLTSFLPHYQLLNASLVINHWLMICCLSKLTICKLIGRAMCSAPGLGQPSSGWV